MLKTTFVALLLVVAAPSYAQSSDLPWEKPGTHKTMRADTLAVWCALGSARPSENTRKDVVVSSVNACDAYLGGVIDSYLAYAAWQKMTVEICIPPNTEKKAIRRAYMAFILQEKSVRAKVAAAIVTLALSQKWPCS